MPDRAPRPPLILASGSPYRRQMLESAGLAFEVVVAQVDEGSLKAAFAARSPRPLPTDVAAALARAKATAVSRQHPHAMVVGADQVLALDGEMLDKPGSPAAARAQLATLRGRTHRLISAAALAHAGEVVWETADEAVLAMRAFSDAFLDRYVAEAGARIAGIVGAYEIEGPGIQLFERVEGDHFTIVGLPLVPLLTELRARGVIET